MYTVSIVPLHNLQVTIVRKHEKKYEGSHKFDPVIGDGKSTSIYQIEPHAGITTQNRREYWVMRNMWYSKEYE